MSLFLRLSVWLLPVLFACMTALIPAASLAQEDEAEAPTTAPPAAAAEPKFSFRQLPINEEARRKRIDVERMLRGPAGALQGENEQIFKAYFQLYELPRFTQADEIANLPDLRAELYDKFRMASRNPEIKEQLNNVVKDFMFQLAVGNTFHPAARVNAVLILGDLEDPQAPRGVSRPWIPALIPLMQIAGAERAPDSLRISALIGIRKHAQLKGRSDESKLGIAEAIVKIANQKDAPGGRSAEGHIWMRRLAMEVLAELGSPGGNNVILRDMITIAGDEEEPLEVRCAAIEMMAALPFDQIQVDFSKLAAVMADVAIDATNKEISADPESESYSPKRLLARLVSLRKGILAISGKGTGPQQQVVNRIDQYLAAMDREAGNEVKTGIEVPGQVGAGENPREVQRDHLLKLANNLEAELKTAGFGDTPASDEGPTETPPVEKPEEELPF